MHIPAHYSYLPYQNFHYLQNQINYYQPYQMYHDPQFQMYPYRQYPDIDVTTFGNSVTAFQKISNESIKVLKKFTDRDYARKLMKAAQMGNQKEVDRLIKAIGCTTPITTEFTPSGILLTIHAEAQGTQCCTLTMFLKWGF